MPLSRIPVSAFKKVGSGLDRPEDVIAGRAGRVFVSEHRCAVAELLPDGSFVRLGRAGGVPNGIALDAQGRIVIANFGLEDGVPGPLERFDPVTGTRETLLTEVDGRTLSSSNFPVLDSAGNIWCSHSTLAPSVAAALDGRADGFLFVVRPDGSSGIVAEGLKFPNGLALSADERFLFCAQTSSGDVLRFPILPGARLGRGERYGPRLGFVAHLKLNPRLHLPGWVGRFLGYTDGIGFDAEGNLWVCLLAANKVVAITPSGHVVTLVHDPSGKVVNSPTNVAWGGPDLKDLYLGSIRADYVLKARSPVAGQPQVHQRNERQCRGGASLARALPLSEQPPPSAGRHAEAGARPIFAVNPAMRGEAMQADTQVEPLTQEVLSTRFIAVQRPETLPQHRLNDTAVENALQFAQDQLARTATELTTSQYPKSTKSDGTWNVLPPTGTASVLTGWTQGFFPGALWYVYGKTENYTWRQRADAWTRPLEAQQFNMLSHDMGFKFAPSFAVAYELTGDPYYRRVALSAAGALASRYNPRVGIISTCDWNDSWQLPLVTDTMMNLELLLWGATQNQIEEDYQGQEGWRDMALSHALRTLTDMVRPNGSTYHIVDYDPFTGNIRLKETYQGKGTETTWSRGQAWAMYGYTMVYRYTRDSRMLEAALRVCDSYVGHLPQGGVPNWDFDAPEQQKDSSAAAIAASALLELITFMSEDDPRRQSYWDVALGTLQALMSTSYLAAGTSNRSILLHGVGDYPHQREIDVGLIYGDYYFLEALLRYRRLVPLAAWYSKLSFTEALHTLGTNNTGVRTVEFDVTPLAAPIDGVVGYADSSTQVTAYSHLAMLIRMNPSGIFDVRNGAGYAYRNRVAYSANTRYHLRMVTDLNARRYSVWIRQSSGPEIQLADSYAFRTDAPATNDLGRVAMKSGHYDNEFVVENHSVT